jgi:tetratricopeptide (TPR) repeat protein
LKILELCVLTAIVSAMPSVASAIDVATSGTAKQITTMTTGPVPSWVKPAPPSTTTGSDQAAVRILLQDQQVDLQPGRTTTYSATMMKLQTSQGLAAGTTAFAWNPDTDTPTVHRLLVHRGDKVIDVLADQRFTIVRRESNLENAMLDGVLTATLQPEGLQVGDVIDFAVSITHSDPAIGRHVEAIGGGWNGLPIGRAHLSARWPSNVPVRLRTTTGLPALKVQRKDGLSSIDLTLEDLPPLPAPKGAPARYGLMRVAELSDFASWADLAQLMAPLYQKAAILPPDGALAKEIATISAQSTDPKVRAQAALTLVQDRIRYVFLGMNDGGLVPADAETTWQRRFGDCKGKTVLLLALLKALGIEAQPVIVNIGGSDGIDQRLPMVALFNHVLVRATITGQTYWLDGTRTGDTSLDQIKIPDFRWGLPLIPNATLVRMEAPAPSRPQTETAIRIDARAGITLPAPMHVETVLRDDDAVAMNQQLTNLPPDALDRGLRGYWRTRYDFVTVKATSAQFDAVKREERLVMDGDAELDWNNGWYQADGVGVGYKADFTRDPGPNRDAPFAVAFPYSTRTTETIQLPPGHFKLFKGDPIDTTVGGITYHRIASLADGRFSVEENEHSVIREFPADQADAVQAQLRALDDKNVFVGKPDYYVPTEREMTAMMKEKPTTADGFVERGNDLMDRHRFDEAIADFTSAIALDPKNALAYADRGVAYAQQHKADEAERDFAAAEKLAPDNTVMWRGRGMLRDQLGELQAAVDAYSKSLAMEPSSTFALEHRAVDYHALGDDAHARTDADAILRAEPGDVAVYLLRANIARAQGRSDDALKQAALVVAAAPQEAWAHVVAAKIQAAYHHWDDAAREFDAALKIQPDGQFYINRSLSRPAEDFAARQADLDKAKALLPPNVALFSAQAKLQEDRKAYADAVATWTAWLAINPQDAYALVRRGIDEQRINNSAATIRDFAAAHALAKNAGALAVLCREKVSANVAIDLALEECRAALAAQPSRRSFQEAFDLAKRRSNYPQQTTAADDKPLDIESDL